MGQKVNPNGIRLGIVKPWNSTWFANTQDFADNLDGDFKVRKFLTKELANASVSPCNVPSCYETCGTKRNAFRC